MRDRELSPRQTRIVFVAAASAVLIGCGWWTYTTWGRGAPDGGGSAEPSPAASSAPAISAGQVEELFPYSMEEFAAAAGVATDFVAALGTVDDGDRMEDYVARVEEHTARTYAGVLQTEEGDSGLWRPLLADGAATWTGRAAPESISYYDQDSITLVVSLESHGPDGQVKDFSDYVVVVVRNGEQWEVERADRKITEE